MAANLSFAGMDVRLLSRKGLQQEVLKYQEGTKVWSYEPQLKHDDKYDLVFICTKAYDIENATISHKHHLFKSSKVVFMTNGYTKPVVCEVAKKMPNLIMGYGVTDKGVTRTSANVFEAKSSSGSYQWSSDHVLPVERHLSEFDSKLFKISSNSDLFLQKKWVVNVVVNSISALHQYKRNGLIDVESNEFKAVFDEAYSLSCKIYPNGLCKKEELLTLTVNVIKATKDNFNSMAYDVFLGRQTESQFLAGVAMNFEGYDLLQEIHSKITGLLKPI